MRKIRDVLRLKLEARLSHERTAAALQISKGVVTKYLTLATAAGLDWNQIQLLDDTALHNRMLGAMLLPQQHQSHAFASQLLVDAPIVGLHETADTLGGAQHSVV